MGKCDKFSPMLLVNRPKSELPPNAGTPIVDGTVHLRGRAPVFSCNNARAVGYLPMSAAWQLQAGVKVSKQAAAPWLRFACLRQVHPIKNHTRPRPWQAGRAPQEAQHKDERVLVQPCTYTQQCNLTCCLLESQTQPVCVLLALMCHTASVHGHACICSAAVKGAQLLGYSVPLRAT